MLHESYRAQKEAGENGSPSPATCWLPRGFRPVVHERNHEEIPERYSLQLGSTFLLVNFLPQKGPDQGLPDYPVQVS